MSTARQREDWRGQGACLTADPDLFFPISSRGVSASQVSQAKCVCARCPVQAPCLRFALSTQEQGIWGGTTEDERRQMRRRARRRAASAEQTAA